MPERGPGRVRCHVCGTRWSVRPRAPGRRGDEVEACPGCEAPLRLAPALDEGTARGLVLLAACFAEERRHHGTVGRYLAEFTRSEHEVDRLLALAVSIDYDAWAADNARRLARRDDARVRAVSRFLPRLAGLADSGALTEALKLPAARLKRRYRAEHAHHLAVFARRTTRA